MAVKNLKRKIMWKIFIGIGKSELAENTFLVEPFVCSLHEFV